MPTFVGMLSWTDQGVRSVKDAPKRTQAARELAKKFGIEIKQVYLTSGDSDLLVILDAPDGDAVAKTLGDQIGKLPRRLFTGFERCDCRVLHWRSVGGRR